MNKLAALLPLIFLINLALAQNPVESIVNLLTSPTFILFISTFIFPAYLSYRIAERWGWASAGIVFLVAWFIITLTFSIYYPEFQFFLILSILAVSIIAAIIVIKFLGGR